MSGPAAPVDAEWSLLLAACSDISVGEKTIQIRKILRSPVRWNTLHSLADHHGVQSLVTQALLSVEDQVPAAALSALRHNYQANIHKALFLSREFLRIAERLSLAGIDFIPYKGLALAEMVY